MVADRQTKVFILGAGCSADCGYPLGVGFETELEKFLHEIPDECPKIRRSVSATVDLFRNLSGVETIDQLTARIEQDLDNWKRQRNSPIVGPDWLQRDKTAAEQILNAKIATSAMFLANEEKARQTRLRSYKSFITQILGGPPWEEARQTHCCLLTFNYDRLFEIAFLESFPTFDIHNHPLYAHDALNSAFAPNFGDWRIVQPTPNQFCFLKLHGSVGWWAKTELGERQYWPAVPDAGMNLKQIEESIPKQCGGLNGWAPLLTFPHERQKSQEFFNHRGQSCGHDWAPYIDTVWQYAASIVANAAEIRVIGYSFNPIDSRYMIKHLLAKSTCKKIVIQNKIDVRRNLASYEQLRDRLDYDPKPFGE